MDGWIVFFLTMVLGKQGLRLEAYKFGLYLFVPIVASVTFNDPDVQKVCADYFQFLKYPANPNTNLKGEFEELLKKRELEKEQRILYAQQVKKLQQSAQKSRQDKQHATEEEENNKPKRKKWLGIF